MSMHDALLYVLLIGHAQPSVYFYLWLCALRFQSFRHGQRRISRAAGDADRQGEVSNIDSERFLFLFERRKAEHYQPLAVYTWLDESRPMTLWL